MGAVGAARRRTSHERLRALGYKVEDLGNVLVEQPESVADEGPQQRPLSAADRRTPARAWPTRWRRRSRRGKLPLVLGGDHSVAVGTVAGVSQHFRKQQAEARPDLARRPRRHEHAARPAPAATSTACRWPACVGAGPAELTDIYGYRAEGRPEERRPRRLRDVDELEKPHVPRVRRARLHHARHRRARHARGDAARPSRSPRTARPASISRFDMDCGRSRRSARRRHAGARRLHLPRSASGHGDDLRLAAHASRWKWWK